MSLLTSISIRIIAAFSLGLAGFAQNTPSPPTPPQATHPAVHSHRPNVRNGPPASELCAACVQDNLNYLAGPELHGRGSGTNDEHKAAEFIADKLKQYGLSPAADGGQYIQTIRQEVSSQGETASATGETRKLRQTWNVLAKIEGATRKKQVIMLSAHLDHLGTKDGKTYFGADDDASGCAAVMELARMLTEGGTTQRTVVVALWGGEEEDLAGSSYFLQHPTFPLKDIVANLEFEMVGRPDPKLKSNLLWLSGWDRTNMGPKLVRHGANLAPDPHREEKFFTRSDNFALAEDGIIAQTVSSFGLHPDYHQPTDTIDKINFQHMDQAIASMVGPITWLANTEFKPEWVKGKKP